MLLDKIKKLEERGMITRDNVLEITTVDELINLINQYMVENEERKYNQVYDVFEIIKNGMLEDNLDINVFYENSALKMYYLERVYGIDEDLLRAALFALGPVYFDYKIEDLLSEDDFYKFYIQRHKEYKQNGEATIYKLLKSLDISELNLSQQELEEVVADLKQFAEVS